MTTDHDIGAALREAVQEAIDRQEPLLISGGDSKSFLGRTPQGKPLNVKGHTGIVNYQPTELVITARAGTPLEEIEAALAERSQMLPFEPPYLGPGATLGGTVACGLSGPRRPYAGAVRDFVLGCRLINGKGQILHFGGEVMKNVAGYDLSRLMAGAMGTLGVLLEVSLKVLPRPVEERTQVLAATPVEAIETMNRYAAEPQPLSGACYYRDTLYLRFSGAASAVEAACRRIKGDTLEDAGVFWEGIREQTHDFFVSDAPLWRLSVPPTASVLDLPGECLMDWGGALRWLKSDAPAESIRDKVKAAGGHATLFRGGKRDGEVFHPLPPALLNLHRNLKAALDPHALFNPGRLYPQL